MYKTKKIQCYKGRKSVTVPKKGYNGKKFHTLRVKMPKQYYKVLQVRKVT